jgi:hypothetical protein
MNRAGILVALVVASVPAAHAQDQAVGAKVGLLGLGVEYSYSISEWLAFRAGLNGAQYGFDGVESDIAYEFDLIWDSVSVAVDLHPARNPFRLTVGVLANDNRLEAESRPANDLNIGGVVYTPAEIGTLRGAIGFDSTAPFVGLGWDWSRKSNRFGVSFDIGLVRQGSPRISLVADGLLATDPGFQDSLRIETAELQAELDDTFDLFPYATLGFVVKF